RIAVATPTPAATGAMDRLNPVTYTLGHVLHREDRLWSQVAQGREPDAALVSILPDGVPGEASPLPWGECLEALDSVEANVGRWLGALTPEAGATPMKWRD